jgi:hypothetical protein
MVKRYTNSVKAEKWTSPLGHPSRLCFSKGFVYLEGSNKSRELVTLEPWLLSTMLAFPTPTTGNGRCCSAFGMRGKVMRIRLHLIIWVSSQVTRAAETRHQFWSEGVVWFTSLATQLWLTQVYTSWQLKSHQRQSKSISPGHFTKRKMLCIFEESRWHFTWHGLRTGRSPWKSTWTA